MAAGSGHALQDLLVLNLFALGLVSWMYSRPTDATAHWIEQKFASKPEIMEANLAAFRAGYNFGETAELLHVHYEVKPAPAEPGTYRGVNGTTATALGLIAASVRSGLPRFYSASDPRRQSSFTSSASQTLRADKSRPRTRSRPEHGPGAASEGT
jgi:2-oxoglutarate ferredoxin oxidoreductase subunit alpha